jgi:integrase
MSNMLPKSRAGYDYKSHLSRQDVVVASDGILVKFKWSKTLQDSSRIITIPLVAIPSNPMCPWTAYSNLLSLVPASDKDSAFTYIHNGRKQTLVAQQVVTMLRIILKKLGYDHTEFSGHSFRRSGATWAFSSGVKPLSIKAHGDWKSLAFLQYIHVSDSQKQMVSSQMLEAI